MSRRWLGAVVAAVALSATSGAGARGLADMEARYQQSASAKRVNDVHKIADLLEAYYARTGRLPLDQRIPPSGYLTVIVGAPKVERRLQPRGNPLGREAPVLASAEMLAALREALGPEVRLPVDPQKAPNGPPNAYYVRFRPNGQYLVTGFLRQPYDFTIQVAPDVYVYALRSEIGDWGDPWDHARVTRQVPQTEREAIRAAGAAEDRRFGQWVDGAGN
ncbi:hypothetical protein [Caulobacter sp. 17J65-9]|uniref:hypothetical protein n=1 Tax=Caulobacter sp. 17J65-9 TaxID=2709382 RepID=UPI0013C83A67|nr:hypothetical protein [Caulobacter sp. 17J65-9]NEX92900.1 hypothetical protein [Caulobacter sp. 17J65-9]